MTQPRQSNRGLVGGPRYTPAVPLWHVAPTRGSDGRCLADFMMLIPRLGSRSPLYRERALMLIREVCEAYGEQIAFADVNYSINVLWVSVAAEPGLAGRVAQSIRGRLPEARLVGGHLATGALPVVPGRGLRRLLRGLSRRAGLLLGGPVR